MKKTSLVLFLAVLTALVAGRQNPTAKSDVGGKKLFESHFAHADRMTSDSTDGERHARSTTVAFIE